MENIPSENELAINDKIEDAFDDLKKAEEELKLWEAKWENYDGNNPNKLDSEIEDARIRVRHIEQYLKSLGAIPKTDVEKITDNLDKLYPNSKSKRLVGHDGEKYQLGWR